MSPRISRFVNTPAAGGDKPQSQNLHRKLAKIVGGGPVQIYVPSGRHGASAALILTVVAGASGTRSRLAQQRVRTGAAETVRETRLNSHEICCTNRCSQERCSAAHAVLSPTYNQCLVPPTTYFPVRPQGEANPSERSRVVVATPRAERLMLESTTPESIQFVYRYEWLGSI